MTNICTCRTAHLATPLGSLQSPIAEIIGIFGAPSLTECAAVREKILQIAADISELDSEIGRVEKILEHLRHNRTALQKHSDGHQNLLNVTRRLPVEILGEVFIQLQAMLDGRSIAPTRVCRHWREVAIGTSRLWSHIKIEYRSLGAVKDVEMASIWLQRSGGQPLNIILGRMDPEKYTGAEKENPALDVILHNQAHRWNNIKLIVTKSMLSFLKNIPTCLPMLHTLHIDGPEKDLGIPHLNNFKHASALRVLTLDKRVSLISSQRLPEFPWARITKFTLLRGGYSSQRYTSQDAYTILRRAVNLQSCTMEIKTLSRGGKTPPSTLLSSLLSLDICVVGGAQIQDLFELLALPALTCLKVIDNGENAVATVPECVAALIIRSGCQLQRLSLGCHGAPFNHEGLLELFKLTPMLSELEIQFGGSAGVDDSLMDLLTHKPDHAPGLCCLLPKLASIRLAVHNQFSYEKFVDLLSSRRHFSACNAGAVGLAQLREAALITWADVTASGRRAYHLPQQTFEGFKELRESGLNLCVIDDSARLSLEAYFVPGEEEDDSEPEDDDEDEDEDEDDDDDYGYY